MGAVLVCYGRRRLSIPSYSTPEIPHDNCRSSVIEFVCFRGANRGCSWNSAFFWLLVIHQTLRQTFVGGEITETAAFRRLVATWTDKSLREARPCEFLQHCRPLSAIYSSYWLVNGGATRNLHAEASGRGMQEASPPEEAPSAHESTGATLGPEGAGSERQSPPGGPSGQSRDDPLFGAQQLPGFGTVFNRQKWTPAESNEYLERRSWEPVATLIAGTRCYARRVSLSYRLLQVRRLSVSRYFCSFFSAQALYARDRLSTLS